MASVIEIKNLTEFHIHYHRGKALERFVKDNLKVVDIDISEDDTDTTVVKNNSSDNTEVIEEDSLYNTSDYFDYAHNTVRYTSEDFGYASLSRSEPTDLLNLRPRNGAVRRITKVESSTQVFQSDINETLSDEDETIQDYDIHDHYRYDNIDPKEAKKSQLKGCSYATKPT